MPDRRKVEILKRHRFTIGYGLGFTAALSLASISVSRLYRLACDAKDIIDQIDDRDQLAELADRWLETAKRYRVGV